MQDIADSSGEAARAIKATFDSPQERAARFNAAMNEATVNIGLQVGGLFQAGCGCHGL